jgi:LAT3 family solute carrier family 43 protein 3
LRRDLIHEGGLSENELGAVFTCGAWSVQGGRFLVGLARDKYGTRNTVVTCLAMVCVGSVLIATSSSGNLPGLCFGMLFLGMGSGAQLCVQPVASLFPEATLTAMASLSGAFQLSGLVFLVCSLVANTGAMRVGAYLGHAVLVSVLLGVSVKVLPKGVTFTEEVNTVKEGTGDPGSHNTKDTERGIGDAERVNRIGDGDAAPVAAVDVSLQTLHVSSPTQALPIVPTQALPPAPAPTTRLVSPATHFGKPSKALFVSDEFLALAVWFSVMVTPSQYYVLSIGYQLERMGDDDGKLTTAFGLIYGGSAPLAPLAGLLADTVGVGFAQLLATALSATGFAFLFIDDLNSQYFGMACYSVGRMMLFATFFANVGRRFGYTHYGSLVGTGMLTSAICSMAQYPGYQLALSGDEELKNVNAVCFALTVSCVPYCVWLGRRERLEWRACREASETGV